MRLEVTIPDQILSQAQHMALKAGVSFDQFITEAVELRLEDGYDGPIPTPELVASLRQAEGEIDSGKGLTMSQVDQNLAAKRAAWLQANQR